MWSELVSVAETVLSICSQVFQLYTAYNFLAALLAIWVVRRILKTFNLI